MLDGYIVRSLAYRAMTPNDRSAYLELKWRYDGLNNGRIGLSVRDLAAALGIGKNAASVSLLRLQELGFVAIVKKGAFNVKHKVASEWLLTEYKCDVTGELARKDFTRWRPEEKNTVPLQRRTVPYQGHQSMFREAKVA
ncbi:hypothetical protein [Mesorhizobium sp.]|uniref:hypothetical protein n=1 Tax=Mesorhizobium sp. TaxID=1871066 RepID=UPI0025B84891|nr:hypothetical protein [Mesorhizobium sp.]